MTHHGLSKKIHLLLPPPTESDNLSAQARILRNLKEFLDPAETVRFSLSTLRKLYPLCEQAGWDVTVSLSYDGSEWIIVDLESGDTSASHYGLAADLGSTTVILRLVDMNTGEIIAQESLYNQQIQYGEDILTRIFYSKDQPDKLEEIRQATVDTFRSLMHKLHTGTGIDPQTCISMVVSGNTTMTHFFLGLDAFCVFETPYAVHSDAPGFILGTELGLPILGHVFCMPSKANYLGGDIISGMLSTGFYNRESISLFFDVGTNGELVVGSKEFLLCGAGAAGPALEGGVVHTGMRAAEGAVETVLLQDGEFKLGVIGNVSPVGICGSGIIDLIAQLFLNGWVDLRGCLQPDASQQISLRFNEDTEKEEAAVCYAPGLYFYQNDINEFLRTKAAAATMMEYMLSETGMGLDDVAQFYMAGAFGTHVDKESAVTIGMYPDVQRDRIVAAGNTSLEGAQKLLLNRSLLRDLDRILGLMTYVQFGAIDNFLDRMNAATAIPHTDLERYPSVKERLGQISGWE